MSLLYLHLYTLTLDEATEYTHVENSLWPPKSGAGIENKEDVP